MRIRDLALWPALSPCPSIPSIPPSLLGDILGTPGVVASIQTQGPVLPRNQQLDSLGFKGKSTWKLLGRRHVATTAAHGAHALGTQFAGSGGASHLILPLLDGGLRQHLDPIRLELIGIGLGISHRLGGWKADRISTYLWFAPFLVPEALLFTW